MAMKVTCRLPNNHRLIGGVRQHFDFFEEGESAEIRQSNFIERWSYTSRESKDPGKADEIRENGRLPAHLGGNFLSLEILWTRAG